MTTSVLANAVVARLKQVGYQLVVTPFVVGRSVSILPSLYGVATVVRVTLYLSSTLRLVLMVTRVVNALVRELRRSAEPWMFPALD